MSDETHIVGIDFSGSKSPGTAIWITEGATTGAGNVDIDVFGPAREVLEVSGRGAILEALRERIAGYDGDTVVGLDFPFGLPEAAVDTESWSTVLDEFGETFDGKTIDDFPGPFDTDGTRKRDCDYRYAGQSPFSPQIKYQVFYGLRDLLYPLVIEDEQQATVSPMQDEEDGLPTLIEVYPAATFGRLCCYRTGYKGSDDAEKRRVANRDRLREAFGFELERPEIVSESDDALDSLCAACTAARFANEAFDEPDETVEGYIYA
ncbi:DUF429 domain-containing protein [Halobacteriales archaeon Cl-PHB]